MVPSPRHIRQQSVSSPPVRPDARSVKASMGGDAGRGVTSEVEDIVHVGFASLCGCNDSDSGTSVRQGRSE